MRKKNGLIILLVIAFLIFVEGLRLHYTIEGIRVSKEIKVQKNENLNLQREISRRKIKLIEKMDLNTIKKHAEEELEMENSKSINYVKIEKSVLK